MTKHLTLLLFIGLAWGQENPDTLTYHNSPKFPGRFLGITFSGFEFEMIDKSVIKKTSINDIQELSINSLIVIHNGLWVVEKKYIKNSGRDINHLHYENYLIEQENYQQDYQQGVTAAKKDWADSQSGPRWDNKDLTDTRAPGFIDGYKKEMAIMAKLKFKGNVIKSATTCCVIYYLFYLSIPDPNAGL